MKQNDISFINIVDAIREKFYIPIITIVIAVFLTVSISYIFIPDLYKSEAIIIVNDETSLLDFSSEKYIIQIKSPQVIKSTITTLDLKDDDNQYISVSELLKGVTVSNIEGTKLIKISVKYKDGIIASEIANNICENYIDYIIEHDYNLIQGEIETIEDQMVYLSEEIEENTQEKEEFINNNVNIEQLRSEKTLIINQIGEYKNILCQLEVSTATDEKSLLYFSEIVETFDDVIMEEILNKNIENEYTLDLEVPLDEISDNNLFSSVMMIEIAEIYSRYIVDKNNLDEIINKIQNLENDLVSLENNLLQSEIEYNIINDGLTIKTKEYREIQQLYNERLLELSTNLNNDLIDIHLRSTPSTGKVSKIDYQVIVTSIILGLLIGIIVVLYRKFLTRKEK